MFQLRMTQLQYWVRVRQIIHSFFHFWFKYLFLDSVEPQFAQQWDTIHSETTSMPSASQSIVAAQHQGSSHVRVSGTILHHYPIILSLTTGPRTIPYSSVDPIFCAISGRSTPTEMGWNGTRGFAKQFYRPSVRTWWPQPLKATQSAEEGQSEGHQSSNGLHLHSQPGW